jgi:hypothetical protein
MRFVIAVLLGAIAVFNLSGAAATDGGTGAVPEQQRTRDAVAARAAARWDALIRNDLDAVYQFEAPGYRKAISLEAFRSRFGAAAVWKEAKVLQVDLSPDATAAEVRVEIAYEPRLPMAGDFGLTRRPVKESWLEKDGHWWHVSK